MDEELEKFSANILNEEINGLIRCKDRIVFLYNDMTIDDAIEYLEYNTFSAYVGEYTPIFIEDFNWL